MISFRYHLVSIIAVFLALALGIVVGTTALNGPITKDLRNQVNDARSQRDDLNAQVKKLQGQVDDAGEFATTYGSQLVAKTLTNTSVLLVSLPGVTSGMRDGVTAQVTAAGGKIGGQLDVTKAYLDPSRSSEISALATGPAHPVTWTAPETNDATKLGASLLAYVLLGKGTAADAKSVVGAFAERRLVTVEGSGITPTTAVVVLGAGSSKRGGYDADGQLALVEALAAGGGKVVVAGNGEAATDGGVVAAVRSNGAESDVSTVDDVDSSLGQVSTTLALAGAIKNQNGNYGTGAGADALFPTPAR